MSCLLALITLLGAPLVEAQGDAGRAQAAFDAGDAALAAAWWREVIADEPSPRAWLGLGEALAAREASCGEAGAAFAAAAVGCGEGCAAVEAAQIEAARVMAAKRCAVTLELTSAPAGAEFELAGAKWSSGPIWAGVHHFTASWPDGSRRMQSVCIAPGAPPALVIARDGRAAVDPSVPAEHRALAHQEAAFDHVERGAACEAAAEFRAAYAARPDPSFIYNEAMANALDARRCAVAIAAFDRFVAVCPDCPQVWAARSQRGELAHKCRGVLAVRLPVPDATVWVDGELSPARSERLPATYRVTVQAPGFDPVTVPAPVETGETRTVEVALMAVVAPPVLAPTGVAMPLEVSERPARDRTWLVVAAGIGAAGLIAGGAFTALAVDDRATFTAIEARARGDASQSYRESLRGHLDAFVFDRALAVTGWTVGGAGLAAAALLWWFEGPAPVQVGPGGVGFGMEF